MITKEDLTTAGIAEEKADQIITDLGDVAKKLTPENVAKKAFDEMDLAVLTLTKIPKNSNEKTTDYYKRATNEFSDKLITEKTNDLNTQIQALKDEQKNHKGDETLKAKISELEKEKAKLPDLKEQWIKEHKDKAEDLEKELTVVKKTNELKKYLPEKIRSDLTPDYIQFKINKAIEKALATYSKEETDKDGNLFLIDEVNVDKILAKDYFSRELDPIIDKGKNQSGGGGGKGEGKKNDGELTFTDEMKDGEKMVKIREHLATQKGITPMSDNWTVEFNKLLKENGLENYMTIKEKKE